MAIAVRGSAWDPFTVLVRQWDADFDNLVRRAFGSPATSTKTGTATAAATGSAPAKRPATGFVPAADVVRDGSDVLVTLELPGIDGADLDIEVSEGKLAISGQRKEQHESSQHGVLVREIRSGGFRREFALPKGVSAEQVEADYTDGLLKVRVRDVVRPAVAPAKVTVRGLTSGPDTTAAADTSADQGDQAGEPGESGETTAPAES